VVGGAGPGHRPPVILVLGGVVVAMIVAVGLLALLFRRVIEQGHAALAFARWEPMGPDARHVPLARVVADLEDEGYVVESWSVVATGLRSTPAVVLVHPDGSTATASVVRSLFQRPVVLEVATGLLPGARWLVTTASPFAVPVPSLLLEVAATRPDVRATVARHRASRAWLQAQGVVLHPVAWGAAGSAEEAQMRAIARDPPTAGLLGAIASSLRRGGALRRPLPERVGMADEVARLRAAQASPASAERSPPW